MAGTTRIHAPPRAPRSGGLPQRFVSIADVDPDLVDGIPDGDRQLARRVLARPVHALEACDPERLLTDDGAVGVLIVAGAVLRELSVAGRVCTEVLGPGDVLSPAPSGSLLRVPQTWKALPTASGIVLDAQFTAAAQRWPSLAANLHRRLLAQGHRSAVHAAVAQLPRVERRVLALMWHLADRWGRVTP
ncbi:MAG TPA: hypothetical protein VGR12_00990, partial [Solirubrobacteraceae bacterium]|nr:hypothetical protein [Solirubrobacteraceae bacterium]